MGFWPFGGGKRQRVVETEDHGRETLLRRAPSEATAQTEKHAGGQANLGRPSSRTRRENSDRSRLSNPRGLSSKTDPYGQSMRSQIASAQPVKDPQSTGPITSQFDEKRMYRQNPLSQSSLGPEDFTVVRSPPTLHAKRTETDLQLPRRKSSKRKAEDFAREREIRAMTSSPIPIPKRPSTLYGTGPLQRDSRQVPGPLNRRLERPTSEISLPLAGSLPDFMDFPNQNSFKVGILAALSPRPMVRYDANPRSKIGKQPTRPNMAIQRAIAEDDVSDKKRIDELADDLDAGGLRELMERDRRRREKKKEADKAKLQRKLQRRAERQSEEEARRARTEAFVKSSPAVEPRDYGPAPESPTRPHVSSFRETPVAASHDDPFSDPGPSEAEAREAIRNPFEDEKDMDIMHDPRASEDEADITRAIPIPVRSPLRQTGSNNITPKEKPSQSTLSPPVSPVNRAVDRSSLSQTSLMNRGSTPEIPESASIERRLSEQSGPRISSWTTFFRRGTRRKFTGPSQGRTTPSEFSNTSRESVSRKQPPVVPTRTFRRSDSATPQRTLSRFREDLPELPISPPDSRMQSPETTGTAAAHASNVDPGRQEASQLLQTSAAKDFIAVPDTDPHKPWTKRSDDLDLPSSAAGAMMLSQSLASVDSEGSWLSGKPSKRQSGISHALKPSQSSARQMPGAFDLEDDADLMEGDFYSRVNLAPQEQVLPPPEQLPSEENQESGTIDSKAKEQRAEDVLPIAGTATSSAEEAEDEKWHQGLGRRPTLVQQAGRARSKEGLLKEFVAADNGKSSSDEADDDDQDSDSPAVEAKETPLLRATSVEYKGHIRHMSAGSAKLLDITRSSISEQPRPPTAAQTSDVALMTPGSSPKLRET